MSLCLGKFEDRPTMPYSTPPGEEDLEYVSEDLPDPKSLDFFWVFPKMVAPPKHLKVVIFSRCWVPPF